MNEDVTALGKVSELLENNIIYVIISVVATMSISNGKSTTGNDASNSLQESSLSEEEPSEWVSINN